MDEDHAPCEFLGFEMVRMPQESAHMGEVGAPEEGGEQPGAAGLSATLGKPSARAVSSMRACNCEKMAPVSGLTP